MGDHQGTYWHGHYPPPTQYQSSYNYQAGYAQNSRPYDYESPAPSGLVHHPSVHPAVESSQWRNGSLPSSSSSYQEFNASSSAGSGHSPTTGTPPGGSLAPYNHSRNYSNWGGPVGTIGDLLKPVPEFPRPPSPVRDLPFYSVGHEPLGGRRSELTSESQQNAPPPATGSTSTKIKPFISKLMALLSDPDSYQDCIVWE